MLSVIVLSAIMLSVIMLSVIKQSAIVPYQYNDTDAKYH
jgi:hypothetical protein